MNDEKVTSFISYHCNLCNTDFLASDKMSSVSCAYCGGKNVVKNDSMMNYKDYFFLPFVYTLNDAKKDYKSKILFNPLVPIAFRKKKVLRSIKKVYLPCILYEAKTTGNISFLGTDKIKNVHTLPKQTFEVGFSTSIEFNNILICSFSKLKDDMLCSISPFNYSVQNSWDQTSLKDVYLLYDDEDFDSITSKVFEDVSNHSVNIVRTNVNHELKKVHKNDLKVELSTAKKVFVPIYLLNVKYKNQFYTYVMNGHLGTSTIDLTSSKLNIFIFGLLLFIILFILFVLFSFLV